MSKKRPPTLAPVVEDKKEEEKLKITDTMTLVLHGSDGSEFRVKKDGMTRGAEASPASASSSPATAETTEGQTRSKKGEVVSVLNNIPFEDLKIGEVIGEGSQGRVRRVQNRLTHEMMALKSIAFSEDKEATRQALHHELTRIKALKHPNIVSSFEAYFREGKLYILMELMDCGTTAHLLKARGRGIEEPILAYMAKQTLIGLAHLHASNVVHRDIKPANLLVNSRGGVKISDFGVAGDSQKLYQTSVGSTPYMSPERIMSQPYKAECDVWSVGVAFAELAIGSYPFGQVKAKVWELCQLIANNQAVPLWSLAGEDAVFSDDLKDFIALCMQPAAQRKGAQELLSHPWLAKAENITPEQAGAFFSNPKAGWKQ